MKITSVKARQILDSRGNPTIEVEMSAGKLTARAAVPSGASTGVHEALEMRDKNKDYLGKSVQKAVRNVNVIGKILRGHSCKDQRAIDEFLIGFDGTQNKSKYGANALLGISLANARLRSLVQNQPLYKSLGSGKTLPRCFFNILNGGKHAGNKLSIQEFMISPNSKNYKKNLQIASEVYHTLKSIIENKYGKEAINVGDEGGFAPNISTSKEALDLITTAIQKAGYKGKVDIAIDAAASEFFKNGKYFIDDKNLSSQELTDYYLKLIKSYPIISLEDPFQEDDFESFKIIKNKTKIQIVGDDLTVTNPLRIREAKDCCNCLLLKVNQIGTLTEAIEAAKLARSFGWKVMVSHRSGETEDTFIADLAVALSSQLKSGAPCRSERTAKYNQLLRIGENL